MTSILVVVTFLAGATWGPTVTTTPISNDKACEKLKWDLAWQISNVAQTNTQGGVNVVKDGELLKVVTGGAAARQMATLICRPG